MGVVCDKGHGSGGSGNTSTGTRLGGPRTQKCAACKRGSCCQAVLCCSHRGATNTVTFGTYSAPILGTTASIAFTMCHHHRTRWL